MTALSGAPDARSANARAPLDTDRLKHLEFIQAVITRLGTNSFLLKGWALTLAAGFLAVSASRLSWQIATVGVVPLLCFWFLDGYFLRQERLFRHLYDDVRRPDGTVEVLSMNVRPYLPQTPWRRVMLSQTLVLFYGALLAADVAIIAIAL